MSKPRLRNDDGGNYDHDRYELEIALWEDAQEDARQLKREENYAINNNNLIQTKMKTSYKARRGEDAKNAKVAFLTEVKDCADRGTLNGNLSALSELHHVGKQYPVILRKKRVIEKIDGKYLWVSKMSPDEVASKLSKWNSGYTKLSRKRALKKEGAVKTRKYVKRAESPIDGPDLSEQKNKAKFLDEAIRLLDVAKRYKVSNPVSFVLEIINRK